MDIVNQIVDESFNHLQTINKLKNDFWLTVNSRNDPKPIHTLFGKISGYVRINYLQKQDLRNALLPNAPSKAFLNYFFYLNAQTDGIMTFLDFQNYLLRFISSSHSSNRNEPEGEPIEIFKRILHAEELFFTEIEPLKKQLQISFGNINEMFNFLRMLFEDISSFSGRANKKTMDFTKFNQHVRIKHGYKVMILTEISYFLCYYQIFDDGGIAFDEFLAVFVDSYNLDRYYSMQFEIVRNQLKGESFIPINDVPQKILLNDTNMDFEREDDDFIIKPKKKYLKSIIYNNGVIDDQEDDLIYVQTGGAKYENNAPKEQEKVLKFNTLTEEREVNKKFKKPASDFKKVNFAFSKIEEEEGSDDEAISLGELSKQSLVMQDSFINEQIKEYKY